MDKGDFKRWRKSLNLSQKEAAQLLGLKRRVVQYYEKGERDGKKVEIPVTVRLACWAIAQGQLDYAGPPKRKEKAPEAPDAAQSTDTAAKSEAPAASAAARKPRAPTGAASSRRRKPVPRASGQA